MRKGFVAGAIVIVLVLVGLWAAAWTLLPDDQRLRAEQGDAKAQFNLGFAYYKGDGVTQDYAESAKWYLKAADQGNAKAQFNLGVAYGNGEGVTQDYAEAVKWWRLAADQGNADAQYNLGVAYYSGYGVTQDYAEAHKWLNLAAAAGDPKAGELRDIVAKAMTPEQIAEAQRLAREWKPKE